MKVFISHQQSDSQLASSVAHRLRTTHEIDCYLDVVDPNANHSGDALGEYLRDEMGKCTQLMAVVSTNTKGSWWVPWEIGIATEKDYPIATYAGHTITLPEYLTKWPYMTTVSDLDKYAAASKVADSVFRQRKTYITEFEARRTGTREFYRSLRAALRQ